MAVGEFIKYRGDKTARANRYLMSRKVDRLVRIFVIQQELQTDGNQQRTGVVSYCTPKEILKRRYEHLCMYPECMDNVPS